MIVGEHQVQGCESADYVGTSVGPVEEKDSACQHLSKTFYKRELGL